MSKNVMTNERKKQNIGLQKINDNHYTNSAPLESIRRQTRIQEKKVFKTSPWLHFGEGVKIGFDVCKYLAKYYTCNY